MSHNNAMQVIQNRLFPQPQRLDHGEHPLREAVPRRALAAEGVLAPEHAHAQGPLRVVVRRLPPFHGREQPQRRIQLQDIGAKGRRLGIRAAAAPLQHPLEFARDRLQPGPQSRSVHFAAAELPPIGEEAFHHLQAGPPNCIGGPSSIDELLEVSLQMGPADLTALQRQLVVDRPAIATDDSDGRLAHRA